MTGLNRFAGHGVLVTGAARGIGAAVARRLAEEGARVLAADRDLAEAELTAAALREQGLAVEAFGCDVADRDSVRDAVERAAAAFGGLDVLVNCAAHCTPDVPLFEDQPEDGWDLDLDITLTGVYRCCRAALPHLAASGRGAVVSIGSVNAGADFGNHAYSAAKAGLGSLTRTLAGHAAARGVRVNLVEPGTVRTSAWADREDELDALTPLYPLGRVGEPADVAAAVAFLASRDAAWITGTTLRVDGGLTAVHGGFHAALRPHREIRHASQSG
ncbi:SDR family NAD(P)-dependent oxidoreductase [Streptomyces sp. NPDC059224]|uniref:SDR family NAD(P)-dependent oxidoreductase n=2 Tax=unclassified Streptomyces TaxID=2593676 RepID=UPI0036BD8030